MLNAADEFSTAASAAIQRMYVAGIEIRKDRTPQKGGGKRSKGTPLGEGRGFAPEIQTHLDKVSKAVDDAAAKQARINLLFGLKSPAGEAAGSTMYWLRGT